MTPESRNRTHLGELFEVGPDGVGYIEDCEDHRVYGLHHSMLKGVSLGRSEFAQLNGKRVYFTVLEGVAQEVMLAQEANSGEGSMFFVA
ncbi:MAG: hypothetical protein K2Q23_11635 [Bryobacteraceae bacterium]|nr:hypothetical protein [Bryobacteraceae bacterium]